MQVPMTLKKSHEFWHLFESRSEGWNIDFVVFLSFLRVVISFVDTTTNRLLAKEFEISNSLLLAHSDNQSSFVQSFRDYLGSHICIKTLNLSLYSVTILRIVCEDVPLWLSRYLFPWVWFVTLSFLERPLCKPYLQLIDRKTFDLEVGACNQFIACGSELSMSDLSRSYKSFQFVW